MDNLKAGRSLDTLVAQKVMGWKSVQRLDIGKGGKRDQYRDKKLDKLGPLVVRRCAALLD